MTLEDTTAGGLGAPTPVNLLFEGALLYFMRGGQLLPASAALASSLPRYQGIVNENILAPCWWSNEGLDTPAGYVDEYFIYSTVAPIDEPLQTTWTIAAGVITAYPNPAPFEIQIDPGYDMFVRRVLTDVVETGGALATVLGKLRTGAGYVLNDAFMDLSRYMGAAEFGGLWKIRGGDSVYIDADLADVSGSGTITLQIFLEGYRRRRA